MAQPHELDQLVGYQLRRASSLLMADLAERLAGLGLRTTEASVLAVLAASPLLSQSEIGRRLAIKRANMVPLVAGLVARGLVLRADAAGRAQPLRLSRSGERLAAAARDRMEAHDQDFFGGLGETDREQLRGMLQALWQAPARVQTNRSSGASDSAVRPSARA